MMRERWKELTRRIGCPRMFRHYSELDAAYSEAHRAYHGWSHVVECLDVWARCPEEAHRPDEIELGIWLHDAVYSPFRSDNEERSAALAARWLDECESSTVDAHRVRRLILATRHPAAPSSPDEALIQDIDLHVLGAPGERYAKYERQIRREYRFVPGPLFRRRRAQLLQAFLDSESLFNTPWFQERYESAARKNLASALRELRGGSAL